MRYATIFMLMALAALLPAAELPPIPEKADVRDEYRELLLTDKEVGVITNRERYADETRGEAIMQFFSKAWVLIPTMTPDEIDHFGHYAGTLSELSGTKRGLTESGQHLTSFSKRAKDWYEHYARIWVLNSKDEDQYIARYAKYQQYCSKDMLKRYTVDFATFHDRFEFARKLHNAGVKTKDFREWAVEMKKAMEEEKTDMDLWK